MDCLKLFRGSVQVWVREGGASEHKTNNNSTRQNEMWIYLLQHQWVNAALVSEPGYQRIKLHTHALYWHKHFYCIRLYNKVHSFTDWFFFFLFIPGLSVSDFDIKMMQGAPGSVYVGLTHVIVHQLAASTDCIYNLLI